MRVPRESHLAYILCPAHSATMVEVVTPTSYLDGQNKRLCKLKFKRLNTWMVGVRWCRCSSVALTLPRMQGIPSPARPDRDLCRSFLSGVCHTQTIRCFFSNMYVVGQQEQFKTSTAWGTIPVGWRFLYIVALVPVFFSFGRSAAGGSCTSRSWLRTCDERASSY